MSHSKAIVFDWDDTFLMSTELTKLSLKYGVSVFSLKLPPYIKTRLGQIDIVICRILFVSLKLGQVFIVTNAESVWVTLTATLFLPKTLKFLEIIPVISAVERYRDKTTGPTLWKYYTMCDILETLEPLDLFLSIGDSNAERFASNRIGIESMGKRFLGAREEDRRIITNKPKTVCSFKMYHDPTPLQLLHELEYISKFLPNLVKASKLTDYKLFKKVGDQLYVDAPPINAMEVTIYDDEKITKGDVEIGSSDENIKNIVNNINIKPNIPDASSLPVVEVPKTVPKTVHSLRFGVGILHGETSFLHKSNEILNL